MARTGIAILTRPAGSGSFLPITPGDTSMTMARAHLVDATLTRWYHCVTRCVRRAFLLGEGEFDRKEWIENRTQELADISRCQSAGSR
jgi:hypothetical protein